MTMTAKRGPSGGGMVGPDRRARSCANENGDAGRRSAAELLAAREQVRVCVCGCDPVPVREGMPFTTSSPTLRLEAWSNVGFGGVRC